MRDQLGAGEIDRAHRDHARIGRGRQGHLANCSLAAVASEPAEEGAHDAADEESGDDGEDDGDRRGGDRQADEPDAGGADERADGRREADLGGLEPGGTLGVRAHHTTVLQRDHLGDIEQIEAGGAGRSRVAAVAVATSSKTATVLKGKFPADDAAWISRIV
ncbi:MAG: hypothetical protein R2705_05610 [Ilumatobacteraceae bacterium]